MIFLRSMAWFRPVLLGAVLLWAGGIGGPAGLAAQASGGAAGSASGSAGAGGVLDGSAIYAGAVADPQGGFAAAVNPAWLGFADEPVFGLQLRMPFGVTGAGEDGQSGVTGVPYNPLTLDIDAGLGFSTGGFGLVWDKAASAQRLTTGFGFAPLPVLAGGLSASVPADSWAALQEQADFSAALLLRPLSGLSFGAVYRADASQFWRLQAGLGLRPLALIPGLQRWGHRAAVFVESAVVSGGTSVDLLTPEKISAVVEFLPGWELWGQYGLDGSWTAGITAGFAFGGFGAGADVSEASVRGVRARVAMSPAVRPAAGVPRIMVFSSPLVVSDSLVMRPMLGGMMLPDDSIPFAELVEYIDYLADDPSVKALYFRNAQFSGGMAHVAELAGALRRFRESGRSVVFLLGQADSLTYLLAAWSGAKVYVQPVGSVMVQGFASTRIFLKDMLERFGIDPAGFESHPAKAANHILTEDGFTPEAKENLQGMLDSLAGHYLAAVKAGRAERLAELASAGDADAAGGAGAAGAAGSAGDVASASGDAILANGPYLEAGKAMQAGLVDGVLMADGVEALLRSRYPRALMMEASVLPTADRDWARLRRPKIAVIYAEGNIATGESVPGFVIGSDTLSRQLQDAADDPSVAAIVLRINSRGGSALASDIIAREVAIVARQEPAKPVVVSMGDAAASGGYYIASGANYIVAYPFTLTGSIGVTIATLQIPRLLDMLDIRHDRVGTSESGFFMDPLNPLTDNDRQKMRSFIDLMYWRFVDVVAEGRDMPREDIDVIARGQVWTGSQALERQLIDELGGLQTALDKAAELAGIRGEYERWDMSLDDAMSGPLAGGRVRTALADGVAGLMPEPAVPELNEMFDSLTIMRRMAADGALLYMPYSLEY